MAAVSGQESAAAIAATTESAGFAPIAESDARILVLGSLPGVRSIKDQQYYAHPRNAFWPIMRSLFAIDGDYAARCRHLTANRIAVWDVLQSARRPGSLDADIRLDAANANDFTGFFREHVELDVIVFNGKRAEALFRRLVAARPTNAAARLIVLPSTSPAYAAMPLSRKLARWREALSLQPGSTK